MLAPFLLFLGLFLGLAQNQQDKEYGGQDAGNGDFGGDGGLPIRCNMFNDGVGCRAVGNDRAADGVLPADSGFGQQLQQVAVIGILCFLQDPLTVATDTVQAPFLRACIQNFGCMVWIAIAYNAYYAVGFPIYNTANSTLVPVSTRNSKQRSTLASLTNIASLGVMGVGSMIFPTLVSMALKEDQHLWFVAMLGVAIFTALTILLQFRFTRERVTEESAGAEKAEKSSASLGEQVKAVTSEKSWWLAMLFYVAFQWGGAMKNGSMTFFCQWVLDNSFFNTASLGDAWGMSQSLLAVLGAIPMAVAAVFVVPLANKFGKRLTCLVGMAIGVAGGVIAGLGGSNIIPVAIGIALKCLGSSPACYLILAMLADVIDHIEYTRGIRTDGLTMSVYSALMVAATPVCNAIFSGILNASGYDQSADVELNTLGQSAAVNTAISVSYIWVETAAYALCAVLVFLWTVEKNLPAEQAAIVERKKGATQ